MPRKKRASFTRDVIPDPKFGDPLVARLVSTMMRQGKRSVTEKLVYAAFDHLGKQKGDDPVKLFKQALDNIKPQVEVRSRRVGGATYQVPVEVRSDRRISLGLRWLIAAAQGRGGTSMDKKLAAECEDALDNKGAAVKKKEDTHRMAEANKAFAHYRW